MKAQILAIAIRLSFAFFLSATALAQGPLTPPPGPPTPTMKSLAQIEPRTEISAATTPGDATSVFRITQPGSYYLSGNVTALPGMNGLKVQSSDVRIDLNGFTIIGGHNSTGILIEAGDSRVEIHHGGVRSFASGISGTAESIRVRNVTIGACTTGILIGAGALVEDCAVSNCQTGISITSGRVARCTLHGVRAGIALTGLTDTGTVEDCAVQSVNTPTSFGVGISAGEGAVIRGCSVRGFGGTGIATGENAAISGCTAVENGKFGSGNGISAGYGSSITNCSAKSNDGTGISSSLGATIENCAARLNGYTGIHAGGYSVVKNCTAMGNGGTGINGSSGGLIAGCVVNGNGGNGIVLDHRGTVQGCNINSNGRDGIWINGILNMAKENTVDFNGTDPLGGAGIHVTSFGGGNRIVNNHVSGNDRGIFLESGGNIVLANSAVGNNGDGPAPAPDYVFTGGSNRVGTIVSSSAELNNASNNANANLR